MSKDKKGDSKGSFTPKEKLLVPPDEVDTALAKFNKVTAEVMEKLILKKPLTKRRLLM